MQKYRNDLLLCFVYEHLKEPYRSVSKVFCDLAWDMDKKLPDNSEKSKTIGRIMDAKDSAVRALVIADRLAEQTTIEAVVV